MSDRDRRADVREDLIKRLFAVAISVGAASTISRMNWVTKGEAPDLIEWEQISILAVAMTATVLSWDGYLIALKKRPLYGFWRFAIDILLVFIYMFLLMTSVHHSWWLPIHALTFLLYAAWDFLTVREHTSKYYYVDTQQPKTAAVYLGGLKNSESVSRGPIITIFWGIYFFSLVYISRHDLSNRVFVFSLFAMVGLVLYRKDKVERFRLQLRLILILILLLIATGYALTEINDQVIGDVIRLQIADRLSMF